MREFLAQNRTEDLIENRAKELLRDITKQYPSRIKLIEDDNNEPDTMYIAGNDYDWNYLIANTKATYKWYLLLLDKSAILEIVKMKLLEKSGFGVANM